MRSGRLVSAVLLALTLIGGAAGCVRARAAEIPEIVTARPATTAAAPAATASTAAPEPGSSSSEPAPPPGPPTKSNASAPRPPRARVAPAPSEPIGDDSREVVAPHVDERDDAGEEEKPAEGDGG